MGAGKVTTVIDGNYALTRDYQSTNSCREMLRARNEKSRLHPIHFFPVGVIADGVEMFLQDRDRRLQLVISFHQPAQTAFDQKQMTAMFNLGVEQAKNGTAFRTQNPASSGQAQTKP